MVTKASVGQAEVRSQEPKANHVSGRVSDIRPFSFASPKVLAGRQIRSRIDRTGLGYPDASSTSLGFYPLQHRASQKIYIIFNKVLALIFSPELINMYLIFN